MASWSTSKKRALMRKRGTEGSREQPGMMRPLLPAKEKRPQPSKADQRATAEAALAEWKAKRGELSK